MATKNNFVANKLLYFLFNNVKFLEKDDLLNNTSEFYSKEDIVSAKKQITNDMDSLKIEYTKSTPRNGSKIEKLIDLTTQISSIVKNNNTQMLPTYVSCDMSKIPTNMSMVNINFDSIFSKINKFEQAFEKFAAKFTSELEQSNNTVQLLSSKMERLNYDNNDDNRLHSAQDLKKTSCNTFNTTKNLLSSEIIQSQPSDCENSLTSEIKQTHSNDNELPYSLVTRKKKQPQLKATAKQNSNDITLNKINMDTSSKPIKSSGILKIVGRGPTTQFVNIKAKRSIINRSFIHISNMDNSCTTNDLTGYLKHLDINVVSCFPCLKAPISQQTSNHDDVSKSMSFRVCIDKRDRQKIFNSNVWPLNVAIKDWKFKKPVTEQTLNANEINSESHKTTLINETQ